MKFLKPQNAQPIAWKKFLLAFLPVVMFGIFGTGCSMHMWREGWAVKSSTSDADKMAGYRRPLAFKNAKGDVTLQYDVHITQYGITGKVNYNERNLGLQRLTNVVSMIALQPATNIWSLIDPDDYYWEKNIYPYADGTNVFVQEGQSVPILKLKVEPDYGWEFPTSECVIWDNEYLWYVPPLHTNDIPMAAVLSKETLHTPAYLYPVKVILFPVFLIGDLFSAPIMYFSDH